MSSHAAHAAGWARLISFPMFSDEQHQLHWNLAQSSARVPCFSRARSLRNTSWVPPQVPPHQSSPIPPFLRKCSNVPPKVPPSRKCSSESLSVTPQVSPLPRNMILRCHLTQFFVAMPNFGVSHPSSSGKLVKIYVSDKQPCHLTR